VVAIATGAADPRVAAAGRTAAAPASPDADAARLATVAALREKLARLGGLAAGAGAVRPATAAGEMREKLARLGGLPGATPRPRPEAVPQVPRLPGFEPETTAAGRAWIRRVDVDLGPLLDAAGVKCTAEVGQLLRLVGDQGAAASETAGAPTTTGRIAVLDIESLGLRGSGVVAFLVGIGMQRGRHLEVHQLLLADPAEEEAQLTAMLDLLDGCAALVTYNGRTFDVPTLRARCIVNRLEHGRLEGPPHCDLLGPVRRLFRDRLGACNLRLAEIDLLGMERIDDVPGFEAPGRYRAWLRGAGPDMLEGVVRHNELDLCATAVLGARLAEHVEGEMVGPVHAADRYRLALHLERHAELSRAERLLRETIAASAGPWDRRAAHRLAMRLRRTRDAGGEAEALALLRGLWRAEPGDLRGARALAVALERAGELDEALQVSSCALQHCRALPAWRHQALRGAPPGGWCADWERRVERLRARVERAQAQAARRSARRSRRVAAEPLLATASAAAQLVPTALPAAPARPTG